MYMFREFYLFVSVDYNLNQVCYSYYTSRKSYFKIPSIIVKFTFLYDSQRIKIEIWAKTVIQILFY